MEGGTIRRSPGAALHVEEPLIIYGVHLVETGGILPKDAMNLSFRCFPLTLPCFQGMAYEHERKNVHLQQ